MSVLRNLESKLAELVEGSSAACSARRCGPVELARRLAQEMDEHRTVSLSRTYAPERVRRLPLAAGPRALRARSSARSPRSCPPTCSSMRAPSASRCRRPVIEFRTDERLGARRVRDRDAARAGRTEAAARRPPAARRDGRHDDLLGAAARRRSELAEAKAARRGRAILAAEGKRFVIGPAGARRSAAAATATSCSTDSNVSRKHARIAFAADGELDRRGPRLDERRAGQRRARQGRGAAAGRRPRRPGHRRRALRGRVMLAADRGRPAGGVPRRALPVRRCGSRAASLRDLRRPDEQRVRSCRRAAAARTPPPAHARRRSAALEPRLIVERAPGPRAGHGVRDRRGRRDGPRGPGRDPARGPVRLRPPRAAHAPGRRSSCSRTSARPTAPTSTRSSSTGPQPLHRGDRVRIGDSEFTYVDR